MDIEARGIHSLHILWNSTRDKTGYYFICYEINIRLKLRILISESNSKHPICIQRDYKLYVLKDKFTQLPQPQASKVKALRLQLSFGCSSGSNLCIPILCDGFLILLITNPWFWFFGS
jgi:hypothetical protein